MAGGVPVLLDAASTSPNIDRDTVRGAEIDAAVVVDTFGLPADDQTFDVVPTIEDAAQALGASIGGISAGLRGLAGIFSFYATKMITTGGQGGVVVSKDRHLVDAVRDYLDFDRRKDDERRFNLQITDLQAAIGRVQLERLPEFLERREVIYTRYKNAGLPLLDAAGSPARYRAVMRSDNPLRVIHALEEAGVTAIIPIEDWELAAPLDKYRNAAKMARTCVSLPCYPTLADGDVDTILRTLETVVA
jgi:perosamine synthetase